MTCSAGAESAAVIAVGAWATSGTIAPAASASEHMKKASFRIPGSSEREYVISDVGRRWDEKQRRRNRDGETETETTEGTERTGQHSTRRHGDTGVTEATAARRFALGEVVEEGR